MASMAYSTWKSLPSGENVLTPWSYSERVRNISDYLYLNKYYLKKTAGNKDE